MPPPTRRSTAPRRSPSARLTSTAMARLPGGGRSQSMGIPHIHVSTDYVFDGRKASPYREDDVPCPLNVYGRSKLDGDSRCVTPSVFAGSWHVLGLQSVGPQFRDHDAPSRGHPRSPVVDDQHGAPTAAIDLAGAIRYRGTSRREYVAGHRGTYHLTAGGETPGTALRRRYSPAWRGADGVPSASSGHDRRLPDRGATPRRFPSRFAKIAPRLRNSAAALAAVTGRLC